MPKDNKGKIVGRELNKFVGRVCIQQPCNKEKLHEKPRENPHKEDEQTPAT